MLRKKSTMLAFAFGLMMYGASTYADVKSWEPYKKDDAMISAMAKSGYNEEMAVVGYSNGNLYLSFNANTSTPNWTRLDSSYYTNLPDRQITSIAISPSDNQSIYVGFVGRKYPTSLWKSGSGGQFFTNLNFPYAEIRGISVSPVDGGKNVYVVCESAVAVSQNYGSTWTSDPVDGGLNVPMPSGSRVSAVATHSRFPNLTVVGGSNGEIFYKNGSSSWTRLDEVTYPGAVSLPDRIVNKIQITSSYELELLVALGEFYVNDKQNLWKGNVTTSGFFWTNYQTDNLPSGNMCGFYTNPETPATLHAANAYMAAYKVSNTWLTNKLGLSVLHYDGDNGQVYNNTIKPNFKIQNIGSRTFNLSDLSIRYWYTIDGVQTQNYYTDWAQAGNDNVTGSFVQMTSTANADNYLSIGFNANAGTLAPNQSTELKARFNKIDWSNYNETNDFSYANTSNYANNTKIGLYYQGNLIWGVAP